MPIHHIRRAPKGNKAPVVYRPPTDVTHMTGTADGSKIGAQTVGTPQLALQSVTEEVIADGAVSLAGAKVADVLPVAKVATGYPAANLASGTLPSGVSVPAANVGNGLVAAQISSVNPSVLTGSGTVPTTALANIPASSLASAMRQACKYKILSSNEPTFSNDSAISFGYGGGDSNKVADALGIMDAAGGTLTPGSSGLFRIKAQAHIRDTVTLGYRAQLYVKDTSGTATVVHATRWFDAYLSDDGNAEIMAEINAMLSLKGGDAYQFFMRVVGPTGGSSSGHKLKGENFSGSSYLSGSFIEVQAVIS